MNSRRKRVQKDITNNSFKIKIMILCICIISLLVATSGNGLVLHALKDNHYPVVKGSKLDQSTRDFLKAHFDAVINDDTIISVGKLMSVCRNGEELIGTSLLVTNIEDENVSAQSLIVVDEDDNLLQPFIEENGDVASIMWWSPENNCHYTNGSNLGKVYFSGTAVFNIVYLPDGTKGIQPVSHSYYYTKNQTCSVSFIDVTYRCKGYYYSYPSGTLISQSYEYVSTWGWTNPTPGTTYSRTNNPLHTSKCIDPNTSGETYHRMDFSITVDNAQLSFSAPYIDVFYQWQNS